ncbi:MAG: DUF1292 domain-containing protein [Erysipelotrichaceae bacterium]|nr:DUF1292 domain-containing protein [Erysipelotrichaceae bacterium]
MIEDNLLMVFENEDGTTFECELQDTVFYDNNEYGVFLPVTDDDQGDVIIVKIEDTDGDEVVFDGDLSDEILEGVFEIFKEHFQDVYEFDED